MKVPLSWLKNFISIPFPVQTVAETLTQLGLEVDKIDTLPCNFTGVVVAELLDVIPHPHADRLRIATAFDGAQSWQIVCGATNCRKGIKTPLARIGATLPTADGKTWKIKKTKLRDIESCGMLCAAEELGWPSSEGILELPANTPVGQDISLIVDPVLDISLTPNLGHCMSILGIARELAATWNIPYKKPEIQWTTPSHLQPPLEVHITDPVSCPRYSCVIVKNISVAPSPIWLKEKIESCGIRSINNVVDVGNFVMLEYGQPLHLFDYDTLEKGPLIIGSSCPYKTLETLDDEVRKIAPDTLMICDSKSPLAFAGVMGGKSSSITEKTKRILIESACFSPEAIRRSSKNLRLRTESSMRFERGSDPAITTEALQRAALLLEMVAEGQIENTFTDKLSTPLSPRIIHFNPDSVRSFLGIDLSRGEILDIFKRLEICVKNPEEEIWHVCPPSYRNDLILKADLMEELARLYGYHNLPRTQASYSSSEMPDNPQLVFAQKVRSALRALGLQEFLTCDLISPEGAEQACSPTLSSDALIRVLHPRSIEQSVLRASLMPGLLKVMQYNQDRQCSDIQGFEVGKVHFKDGEHIKEPTTCSIILMGKKRPHHFTEKSKEHDFFDLKGHVENLFEALKIPNPFFEPAHLPQFHPGRQAWIKINGHAIGILGELHPTYLRSYAIENRVFFAECNVCELHAHTVALKTTTPIPLYPSSVRDWTISVQDIVTIQEIIDLISAVKPLILEQVFLLDLYKSDEIGKDRKNATLRFIYRDRQKTLSVEFIEEQHAQLIKQVAENLRKKHEVINEI